MGAHARGTVERRVLPLPAPNAPRVAFGKLVSPRAPHFIPHRMKNPLPPLALCAFALVASPAANATLLTYSGFGNAAVNTNIDNLADGTGWLGNWQVSGDGTAAKVLNTSPLTYGNLATTSNYYQGSGFSDSGRQITNAAGTLTNGTYWASFLVDPGSATPANFGFGFAYNASPDSTTFPARGTNVFGIGRSGSNWIAGTGPTQFASNNFTVTANQGTVAAFTDATTLLVFKFVLSSTSATNEAHVWINPNTALLGGADLNTSSALYSITGLAANSLRINGLYTRLSNSSSGNDSAAFDEFRLGTSFADVTPTTAIPEPGTYAALAGLGALALATLRRRR